MSSGLDFWNNFARERFSLYTTIALMFITTQWRQEKQKPHKNITEMNSLKIDFHIVVGWTTNKGPFGKQE